MGTTNIVKEIGMNTYYLVMSVSYKGESFFFEDDYKGDSVIDIMDEVNEFLTVELGKLDDKFDQWFHYDLDALDQGDVIKVMACDGWKNSEDNSVQVGIGTLIKEAGNAEDKADK